MIRDISGLMKPKSVLPVVARAGQYLRVMQCSGRKPDRIVLAAKDYDTIIKSLDADRQPHEERVTGLRYRDVTVQRAGA